MFACFFEVWPAPGARGNLQKSKTHPQQHRTDSLQVVPWPRGAHLLSQGPQMADTTERTSQMSTDPAAGREPHENFTIGVQGPGYLKAVWPDFCWVHFRGLAGPGGPGKPSKMCGASPSHFARLSRAPGAGQTSKTHPQKSGQTAFRFPGPEEHTCLRRDRRWPT